MARRILIGLACALAGHARGVVPFANPPELTSSAGVLSGTLAIAPATVRVAGRRVHFRALYDGSYMPPVLRVQPGDVVRLAIQNGGSLPTNVHYHGFQVSPLGAGDNVFLAIDPTTTFRYEMPIPSDHAQGLFWYHPHFHPRVNNVGANIYYKLHFDGQPFFVIALDGNLKNQIVETRAVLLPPGQRAEVLVYFQVTEINGQQQPFTGYQDTIDLPPATKRDGAGFVKVIIPFTNPVIVGEFVYHCHIVQHADQGMMANILVVDPAKPPPDVVRCAPPAS